MAPPRAMVLFPFAVGRALAQIDRATGDFRSSHPCQSLDPLGALDAALAVLLPLLADRPEKQTFQHQLSGKVRARLVTLAGQGLTWGLCHGDVTLDNVHVAPDGRIVFYDFDSAGPGWQASVPYGIRIWLIRGKPEYWEAFLAGYESILALGEADRQALPVLPCPVTRLRISPREGDDGVPRERVQAGAQARQGRRPGVLAT